MPCNSFTDHVVAVDGSQPATMTINASTSVPQVNGFPSPLDSSVAMNEDAPYESDSDLSEARDPPPAADTSLSTDSTPQHQSEFGNQDIEFSDPSEAEDGDASEDGDFDVDDSPAIAPSHNYQADRSSSHDSRRPPKRKQAIEDDEFIKANPELYGLRRSVLPTRCVPCLKLMISH